jgi:hypothetical protein
VAEAVECQPGEVFNEGAFVAVEARESALVVTVEVVSEAMLGDEVDEECAVVAFEANVRSSALLQPNGFHSLSCTFRKSQKKLQMFYLPFRTTIMFKNDKHLMVLIH